MEKICNLCNKSVDELLFSKNASKPDGLGSRCLECARKYAKAHYKNNKEYHRKKNKNRREQLGKTNLGLMNEYKKEKGCCRCKKENDPACLDFHHPNGVKKEYAVSKKYNQLNWSKLVLEIEKCEVLCANCHRKLHTYGLMA